MKSWLIEKDPEAGKDWEQKEKGVIRGWDGWMASATQWTWVWARSRRWWRTGEPGVLLYMLQRVGDDLAAEQQQPSGRGSLPWALRVLSLRPPACWLLIHFTLYEESVLCFVAQSCLTLWPHGLWPTTLLCPWGFSRPEYWSGLPCPPPGDLPNPGLPHCGRILYCLSYQGSPRILEGNLSLLQGIFLIQELNRGLHCRQILYQLSYQESLWGI